MNNELNTEIEQVKMGINLPARPPLRLRLSVRAVLAAAGAVVFVFGIYYFFVKADNLADFLPADTPFYISLSLPRTSFWFEQVFDWQRGDQPNPELSRAYQKLDLISWPQVGFQEKLLPLFADKLELARSVGGGLVFKTKLKDKPKWLALFNLSTQDYTGQIVSADLPLAGWWPGLTKNANKINWQIIGNNLYLSDQSEILLNLSNFKGPALARYFSTLGIGRSLAVFYARDKDFLGETSPLLQTLLQDVSFPAVVAARQANKSVNFTVYNQNQSENKIINPNTLAWQALGADTGLYWHSAAAYPWLKDLSPILLNFYNLDTAALLTKIGTRENLLIFFGQDWLFNIADKNLEPDNELMGILGNFGQSLFAISHPQAVERVLTDGSKMTELRAETEGLDWQSMVWSHSGESMALNALSGQGEEQGYFLGFIPKVGYVLSTSLSVLDKYMALEKEKIMFDIKATGCSLPAQSVILGSLPINLLSKDTFLAAIVKQLVITSSQDDKITGCLVFVD